MRDQRLAALANQLAEELRGGTRPDIESLLREHADLADELRGLWATMLVADCVAAGVSAEDGASSGPQCVDPSSLAIAQRPGNVTDCDHQTTPLGEHTDATREVRLASSRGAVWRL